MLEKEFLIRRKLTIKKGAHIILVGNNLGSRMMNYGYFETELQLRYPESLLYVRNMCDGGNTPGFRPHSGRPTPWAFPGAEKFQTELANDPHTEGFLEYPDAWISNHKADIIIAMFGFDESFQGAAGLENYKAELDAFIKHTLKQKYNGKFAATVGVALSNCTNESSTNSYISGLDSGSLSDFCTSSIINKATAFL